MLHNSLRSAVRAATAAPRATALPMGTPRRAFSSSRTALAQTLLYVEHKAGDINPASLVALTAASKIGGEVHALVVGGDEAEAKGVADKVAKLPGLSKVLTANASALSSQLSEPIAPLLKAVVSSNGYTHLIAGHTAVGRDIMPRASALLDSSQISDIIGINSEDEFDRPIYAGNAILSVKSSDKIKVVTVRGTAFDKAALEGGSATIEAIKAEAGKALTEFLQEKVNKSSRPDLATAGKVVSGGRALKSGENFTKYIEPLADALGAAIGASRAAVDAGYADNALQVGQTGKIIAPEMYLAVGISGAIQHLAGMKDSKVIAAINKDPDAPIFQVADYGLVADLYEAVPELLEKAKK